MEEQINLSGKLNLSNIEKVINSYSVINDLKENCGDITLNMGGSTFIEPYFICLYHSFKEYALTKKVVVKIIDSNIKDVSDYFYRMQGKNQCSEHDTSFVKEIENDTNLGSNVSDITQFLTKFVDSDDFNLLTGYAIGELLGNVFDHAKSPTKPFVSAQVFPNIKQCQICVSDCGIGFYKNLKGKRYSEIINEESAVLKAIQKDVTGSNAEYMEGSIYSESSHNIGYGLYKLCGMMQKINGTMIIISNNGMLTATNNGTNFDKQSCTLSDKGWKGSFVILHFPTNFNANFFDIA